MLCAAGLDTCFLVMQWFLHAKVVTQELPSGYLVDFGKTLPGAVNVLRMRSILSIALPPHREKSNKSYTLVKDSFCATNLHQVPAPSPEQLCKRRLFGSWLVLLGLFRISPLSICRCRVLWTSDLPKTWFCLTLPLSLFLSILPA